MDILTGAIFIFAAYGFVQFLISAFKLVFGNSKKKKLEKERMDAAMKELEQQEAFKKRDDLQTKLIEQQKQMISLLEEKLSVVENPVLPHKLDGFNLVYEYDLVPIYVPEPKAFEVLEVGCRPSVCQDKENKFDERAVSLNLNGKALAYLRRGKFQDMANDFLEREDGVIAFVTYLNRKKLSGQILLGFYRNPINAHLDADDDQNNGSDEEFK